jgi:hypothetical protein
MLQPARVPPTPDPGPGGAGIVTPYWLAEATVGSYAPLRGGEYYSPNSRSGATTPRPRIRPSLADQRHSRITG